MELGHLASNCSVSGENPGSISIVPDGRTTVAFTVMCVQTGSIEVSISSAGVDLDLDGYLVHVVGADSHAVATSGTFTVSRVGPGTRTIWLEDVTGNCMVSGGGSRTVEVRSGATVLGDGYYAVRQLRWAPEGAEVAAIIDALCSKLVVLNADGARSIPLTADPLPCTMHISDPAWGPRE